MTDQMSKKEFDDQCEACLCAVALHLATIGAERSVESTNAIVACNFLFMAAAAAVSLGLAKEDWLESATKAYEHSIQQSLRWTKTHGNA